jgi:mannose-6-phosphate isomerase-like protein (cupin superfamily)
MALAKSSSSGMLNLMRTCVAAAVLLIVATHLEAQAATAEVQVVSPARLRAIADSLPPAASRTAQLGKGDGFTYALTQRESSGGIESHRDWNDVFVIQRGSATLFAGGTLVGATESSPGELRGGTIRGGSRRPLAPGDVVVIPAGVPHQMLLERGHHIAYLAFKVAATANASSKK